jgi:carbonyl reductase 1
MHLNVQGIGLEIVKLLGSTMTTVLTSRNVENGRSAVQALKKQDSKADIVFHQLDIDDKKSVDEFVGWVSSNYGRVSILVNNAAIAFKSSSDVPFHLQTDPTFKTNVYSTMDFTDAMLPLLQHNSRIVFLASQAGTAALGNCSRNLQTQWEANDLSRRQIYDLLDEFRNSVQRGTFRQDGWPESNYGMSKLAIIALTKDLSRTLQERNILVNSCCPGFCRTNMSSHRGNRDAARGADTP